MKNCPVVKIQHPVYIVYTPPGDEFTVVHYNLFDEMNHCEGVSEDTTNMRTCVSKSRKMIA